MFKPVSFLGKFFKWYLLFSAHPFKIRIENFIGTTLFRSGIKIGNKDGVVFKLNANDWMTRVMIEQGYYEVDSIQLAKNIVKTGGVCIDIGANFGLYSCILGCHARNLKIYAIEPNYQVLSCLEENIQLNQLREQVQIINVAVSDQSQFVYLEQPAINNLGTTLTSVVNRGGVSILTCSLASILAENNIKQVDLLKIDIEGNEFSVFESFPFEKYTIKNIILEFNVLSKIGFLELKHFFEKKGYTFLTVKGEKLDQEDMGIPENNIWITHQNFLEQSRVTTATLR